MNKWWFNNPLLFFGFVGQPKILLQAASQAMLHPSAFRGQKIKDLGPLTSGSQMGGFQKQG